MPLEESEWENKHLLIAITSTPILGSGVHLFWPYEGFIPAPNHQGYRQEIHPKPGAGPLSHAKACSNAPIF